MPLPRSGVAAAHRTVGLGVEGWREEFARFYAKHAPDMAEKVPAIVRQARRALALQKVRLAGEPESELTLTSAHWTVLERQRCCSSTC